jgi:Ca2+-binding EF-hand superfamily protein
MYCSIYLEFLSSAQHKNYEENDIILEKAFNLIDKDGDGYLDEDELRIAFGGQSFNNNNFYQQIIKETDLDGDRRISRE